MKPNQEHLEFLNQMGIEPKRVLDINLDVGILLEIAKDYKQSQEDLLDSAEHIAKKIQRCKQVHSVRWRVKDVSHLIEKIIRKKEALAEKYTDINVSNYKSKIDDLIGVRAIYLFKHDWLSVHQHILSKWTPLEDIIIYYREGDDLEQYLNQPECKTKQHNDSYRSIHYIVPAGEIHSEKISCEVQTRTIFEEAWSEIDHKVRYPSFSNDPHLKQFLNIFNRLAGSADEMGSYVISLVNLINNEKKQLMENLVAQQKIDELEDELSNLIEENKAFEDIKKKNSEIQKLKEITNNISERVTISSDKTTQNQNPLLASAIAQLFGIELPKETSNKISHSETSRAIYIDNKN
ncbi:hypothetical protein F994_02931 [Acinetobacter bohemicus ANC 3994]|uniref:RelA/SpoT domain-containing protein n=1 Tax=Acinetobacter bohemicus ANC 3994 TaxID=1217715 RepID=N8QBI4_9GAMM|nr:RelA/SpoT domain-containing protein [Acinetobacter bohemicus]ENU18609.1 hypothetical protein F994_02931 [Acinetobacter bohemicus ANC 3994]